MAGLKAANLGLKSLLELGAIAAFAYWGASRSPVILAVILAIAMPAVFVAAWGIWAAPRSPRRLPTQTRVPFELGCFTVAAVALIAAGASRHTNRRRRPRPTVTRVGVPRVAGPGC